MLWRHLFLLLNGHHKRTWDRFYATAADVYLPYEMFLRVCKTFLTLILFGAYCLDLYYTLGLQIKIYKYKFTFTIAASRHEKLQSSKFLKILKLAIMDSKVFRLDLGLCLTVMHYCYPEYKIFLEGKVRINATFVLLVIFYFLHLQAVFVRSTFRCLRKNIKV